MRTAIDEDVPWRMPRAAYVHIPFCAHHCGYCDFAVAAGLDHLIDSYLDSLERELQLAAIASPVGTLFLGGGTPSHLAPPQLERLCSMLGRHLSRNSWTEVSLEANPDSFDDAKATLLADHGVTRVSIGVQSFQPPLLRVLERQHDPGHVGPAVAAAKKAGLVVSIDLMFGVPGETLAGWQDDLARALALEPDHISTYGLTFEKGTRLWKQQQRREVIALAEDLEADVYMATMEILEAAGYEQYEISSFARPGARCRHNQVYWANDAFWGFGVGAAAYVRGERTLNVRNTQEYIRRLGANISPVFQRETLEPEDRARETITLNLRRVEGVIRDRFFTQTGYHLDALIGPAIQRHVALGLITDDGASVRLTRAGRCVADSIVAEVL